MATYFAERPCSAAQITVFREDRLLGSAGVLREFREFFLDGPVLVTPCDMLTELDYRAFIAQHELRRPMVTVAGAHLPSHWAGDYVQAEDGLIATGYVYKPGRPVSELGAFGTWICEPEFLAHVPADAADVTSQVLVRRVVSS